MSGLITFIIIIDLFFYFTIKNYLLNSIDNRLVHELDRILQTIRWENGTLKILNNIELNERDFYELSEKSFFLQICDLNGNLLLQSKNLHFLPPIPINLSDTFQNHFDIIKIKGSNLRSYYHFIYKNSEPVAVIQLSTFIKEQEEILENIFRINKFLFPAFLLLIIIISLFLAKSTIEPIIKIINRINELNASNKLEKIEEDSKYYPEIKELIRSFNNLISHAQDYLKNMSQFTDNAAHQLLSPLTALKSELYYLSNNVRSVEDYKESLNLLVNQTDKLVKIVKTLLILAKLENFDQKVNTIINASNLIDEEIKKNKRKDLIKANIESNIYLRGNEEYFTMMFDNLVDNALKYSGYNSEVDVNFFSKNSKVFLIIKDYGIGINEEEKEKIFERFYRSEKCMRLNIEGTGLGLCLVKNIVKYMNGKIYLENNSPKGTIIKLEFPILILE